MSTNNSGDARVSSRRAYELMGTVTNISYRGTAPLPSPKKLGEVKFFNIQTLESRKSRHSGICKFTSWEPLGELSKTR